VWRQSNKYRIPRIAYINKMDKYGADFSACVKSIEKKLSTTPILLQIPIGEQRDFRGVVDLIQMRKLLWDNEKSSQTKGMSFEITSLDEKSDGELFERAWQTRIRMIEKLAQSNEQFAELLLDKFNLNYEKMNDNVLLETYLRQSSLKCQITPVLCGSSFRNMAVQPLMDAIVKYLPCPYDLSKNNLEKYCGNELFAVCFKIIHDHQKARKRLNSSTNLASLESSSSSSSNAVSGTTSKLANKKTDEDDEDVLSFVRVYNGHLEAKAKVYNVNEKRKEQCDKIYIPFSNQIKQVNKLRNGEIGIVSGLLKTSTGDVLVGNKHTYERMSAQINELPDKELILMKFDCPPPVYFCTVEPNSDADEKRLHAALKCLQREDPSLKVLFNDEDNLDQTVLQGMGQLHLDIVKDRILKEYKLKAFFGPLNIAYKEMPTRQASYEFNLEKVLNGKKSFVRIELAVLATKSQTDFQQFQSVSLNLRKDETTKNVEELLSFECLNAINHGISSAFKKGVLARNPIVNADVQLIHFDCNKGVSLPYISSAAFQCAQRALQSAQCVLIQPIMFVQIQTNKEYSSRVYNDLTRRNAIRIQSNQEPNEQVSMSALVPLAKLNTYSSDLRRLTSGNSTFTIEFNSYEQLSQREYQDLVNKAT
jgi:elongation factor G